MHTLHQTKRGASVVALLLIAAAACLAQAQPQPGAQPPPGLPGDALAMMAAEWAATPVVKGAPYCADAVAENTIQLADGNRISRKFNTRLCRDAEGRTRQEMERNGNRRVFINDVVGKQLWMLNPERRVANLLPNERFAPARLGGPGAEPPLGDKMRDWARRLVGKDGGKDGPGADATAREAQPVALGQVQGEARGAPVVGVQRLPGADAGAAPSTGAIIPGGGPQQWQQRMAARGPGVVTSLGQKEFEGVSASGRLTTWTIEAGKIGNEKPLVSTSEVWTAADLQLTLYARITDPRNGESTYKLVNVQRNAALPEQFRVPEGYRVRDFKQGPPPPEAPASR